MKLLIFLSLLYFVNYVRSAHVRVDPLVLISQGLIRGEKSIDGDYSSFLGIPYAQVDMDNPFGESLPYPEFDEVYYAKDDSVICPQKSGGSLDCLRLNVYVPTQASTRNPMPVLVYIHGGSYIEGFGTEYFGGSNLLNQDIVVVTVNYRLGAYGFLCLDIPSVPGNQGLKDQHQALRWVRQNIAAFGGNPYNVTLAGESAGAASVVYQLYSPHEKLFHKVIIQSGVPQTGSLLYHEGDKEAALKLAEHLGYNTTDTNQALQFLATTSPNLVIGATQELNLILAPCQETSFSGLVNFIPDDPLSASNPNKIKDTPILIGTTSNEYDGMLNTIHDRVIETALQEHFTLNEDDLQKAADVIKHFYIGDLPVDNRVKTQIVQFMSDIYFNHPTERTIKKLLSENVGPFYEFVFNYVGDNDEGEKNSAGHTLELKYLFAKDYATFNDEEKSITDRMTYLWANFIKYGNPTPSKSELVPFKWEQLSNRSRPYMKIDVDISLEHRFRKESMTLFDLFFDIYGQYSNLQKCSIVY